MLAESHPIIRRFLRFLALPYCYFWLVNWEECTATRYQVIKDLLYIFIKLKHFPRNYSICRLWEMDRKRWGYYYGSSYDPYQRMKLRKEVQRIELCILFDDKEVCEYICRGIKSVRLPNYYGVISPDMDYKQAIEDILNSTSCRQIIIKPVQGHAGQGIVLAYKSDALIKVKIAGTENELSDFRLKYRSIIQEVIIQDDVIAKISSVSVNTIRVVTLYTKSNDAIIISVNMRFGVGDAFIDNVSAGGIHVGVDLVTGRLKKIAYDNQGNRLFRHPSSNVEFNNYQLPRWEEVIQMSKNIQKACPYYKLLGLDIALTKDGPVLIEINPNADLIYQEQGSGPLLEDERVRKEFEKYDLLISDIQKNLI